MQNKIKKPWERIFLGIIYMLFSMATPVISGFILYVYIEAYILAQNSAIAAKMLGLFPLLYGGSFIFMAISLLMVVGIFVGKRWVILITLLLSVSNILSGIVTIFKKITNGQGISILISLIGISIMVFAVWLAIACLKHPFYGGNGKITLDTFKFWKKRISGGEKMTTF